MNNSWHFWKMEESTREYKDDGYLTAVNVTTVGVSDSLNRLRVVFNSIVDSKHFIHRSLWFQRDKMSQQGLHDIKLLITLL